MRMSMSKYLKPIDSQRLRTRIRKAAWRRGFVMSRIGNDNKETLAEAVFEIMNDFEHSMGNRHPHTLSMLGVMNDLYDDMGWNEKHPKSDPENCAPTVS